MWAFLLHVNNRTLAMKKMIWIMNHYAGNMFLENGGRHYWFATELKKRGYKPVVFCCNIDHASGNLICADNKLWKECLTENGIPFVFIRSSAYRGNGMKRIFNMLLFTINLVFVAKRYAKVNGRPDVILASSVHPFTLLAGEYLAKKMKISCVCEIRDLWPESIVAHKVSTTRNVFVRYLYKLEKRIYTKADRLIFTMEGGREYIIEKGWSLGQGGKIDLNKVFHINNGVDLNLFKKNVGQHQVIDEDLQKKDIFKVVYTGTIRKANQVEKLVQVAECLKQKNEYKIKILIWGDGDRKEQIQKEINDKELDNIILKGKVSKKQIPYILSQSDLNVFILPNLPLYKYGISLNKMFEYFASGKPVLASGKPGYSIIDKYKCGKSLEAFDANKMADEIVYFANMSDEKYNEYCNASTRVAELYDYGELTNQLISILFGF